MKAIAAALLLVSLGTPAFAEDAWVKDASSFCSVHPRAPGDRGESPVTLIVTVSDDDVEVTSATVKGTAVTPDAPNDVNKPPTYVFRLRTRKLCSKSDFEVTLAARNSKTGEKLTDTRKVSIGKVN